MSTNDEISAANADTVLSPHWRHVAFMLPRLRPQAKIQRHVLRGKVWHILHDEVNGRFHRLTPELYRIVALMNGARTVQDIWTAALAEDGEHCPTQDEIIQLLGRLHSADLLRGTVTPDLAEIAHRARFMKSRVTLSRIRSPLALRLPLVDPERFLSVTVALARPLFSIAGGFAWLGVLVWGAWLAALHWSEFTEGLTDRVLSADNLLLLWLLFPLVKIVHELGHGYAAKVWGGEVHEMGIMFLVFVPVPYVEASSATAFRSRWRRMVVGAGGMLAEIPLAVVALWLWTEMEPGLARTAMHNVVLIAGVSTVLFNGNPLLRFDGYYILMDFLEMPNLGPRANRYVGYLVQRHLFGASRSTSPADSHEERKILLGYSVLSYVYRLFIMTAIILFVATKFFTIGVLLALWAAFQMFVLPILKMLKHLAVSPQLSDVRFRAISITLTGAAALSFLVLLVDAPLATIAEGVVAAPEEGTQRSGAEGFVTDVFAKPGQTVRKGDPLFGLEEPLLAAEIAVLKAQINELEAHTQRLSNDPAELRVVKAELDHTRARLARSLEHSDALVVRASRDGQFFAPALDDLVGQRALRGEALGVVTKPLDAVIIVAVPAQDIDLIRRRLVETELRPVWDLSRRTGAEILSIEPGATRRLRSPVLTVQGGGQFSVAPGTSDELMAIEAVFHVTLSVPNDWPIRRLGDRVYVRFDLGSEPLGVQAYRSVRRLFLKRFDV